MNPPRPGNPVDPNGKPYFDELPPVDQFTISLTRLVILSNAGLVLFGVGLAAIRYVGN